LRIVVRWKHAKPSKRKWKALHIISIITYLDSFIFKYLNQLKFLIAVLFLAVASSNVFDGFNFWTTVV